MMSSSGHAEAAVRVAALYRYPIKSCAGTRLEAGVVGRRGFAGDRALMLVDPEGRFLTQRERPRLALIAPRLEGETLTIEAPGMPPLTVVATNDGPRAKVVVWRDRCAAIDQGDAAADWFGDFLGAPCRLARMDAAFVRRVDGRYARRPDDQTGFADGYPFLLISAASLDDLNGRLASPLAMNRFRPNIVVTGCPPYAEDRWRRIRIGPVVFDLVKPCARCVITTTDQATAERGQEPLRTLATYRRRRDGKVLFGQNLVHEGEGVIRAGDAVEILEG
jgi:MOSC domain-containing protein